METTRGYGTGIRATSFGVSRACPHGDSDPDLAVVNQSDNNVSVLLGGAGGTFTAGAPRL
jgi:hypothetical protein